MATESQRIAQDIGRKRENLGSNLQALEDKVRDTVDWRKQFDRHPWAMAGAAAGAGFVLSRLFTSSGTSGGSDQERERAGPVRNRALSSFDHIKTALLASVATEARNFLSGVVPSFREYYDQAERAARVEAPASGA